MTIKNKQLYNSFGTIFLAAFFLIAAVLRVYRFEDLLILKSDQARDALTIWRILFEKTADLPLLGPQVGGSLLQLGPIYTYLQIFSVKVFGAHVAAIGYPDLFFGIMTPIALYFLLSIFFRKCISISLSAIASVSYFLVLFSRFAWNPNSLPFFMALLMLVILLMMESSGRKRILLMSTAGILLGVISQLHLFAFLVSGGMFSIFFLWVFFSRDANRISIKEAIGIGVIIILMNFPVILNEYTSRGAGLLAGYEKKESVDRHSSIIQNVLVVVSETLEAYWLTLTGIYPVEFFEYSPKKGLSCNDECRSQMGTSVISLGLLLSGIALLVKRLQKEKESARSIKYKLIASLIISCSVVLLVFSQQVVVRFYLAIIPLFLLLIGFVIEAFLEQRNIFLKVIGVVLIMGSLFSNAVESIGYINNLQQAQFSSEKTKKDLRFGEESKVTLVQLRALAREVERIVPKEDKLLITGDSKTVKSLYFVLAKEYGYEKSCYVRGTNKRDFDGYRAHLSTTDELGRVKTLEDEHFVLESTIGTLSITIFKQSFPDERDLGDCLTY